MISILLNIYVVTVLLATIAMVFCFYKMYSLKDKVDMSKVFRLEPANKTKDMIDMLMFLFCPIINVLFTIAMMFFVYLNDERSIELIHRALDDEIERKEKEKYEKNDNI